MSARGVVLQRKERVGKPMVVKARKACARVCHSMIAFETNPNALVEVFQELERRQIIVIDCATATRISNAVGDTLAALGVRFEDWLEKEAENEQELLIERRMPKAVRAPVPVAKSKTSEGKKNSKRTRSIFSNAILTSPRKSKRVRSLGDS
ncbi:hypothetical protein CPB85DRAFT_1457594 [Mucidula mucida]|nr:hypothetical protein CPB85DRAFT_1457594 [Mucidula mucida]